MDAALGGERMELDATIKQVERLYQTVTGHDMPPMDPKTSVIPPERDPMKHVEEQIGRLEQALGELGTTPAAGPAWAPRLSVWEADDAVFVCVNLPGVQRTDLRITVSGQAVVIEGTRNVPAAITKSKASPAFGEDVWGPFARTIPMPPHVRLEEVEAKLQDGLLTIRMKRGTKPEETERTIPVN